MGFPEATSFSFLVSIDSVTYSSTPFTILTQEAVLSWNRDGIWTSYCIDHRDSKLLCSKLGRFSYSWESILTHESLFHFEASCILGKNVASVVLLLYHEKRSIVLFRKALNPHQNTVWIISGLLTIVQISARIFAPTLPVAVPWSEFLQQKGK